MYTDMEYDLRHTWDVTRQRAGWWWWWWLWGKLGSVAPGSQTCWRAERAERRKQRRVRRTAPAGPIRSRA